MLPAVREGLMAQADPYGDELKGIGGWLILPLGGLIIIAVILFGGLLALIKDGKVYPIAIAFLACFLAYICYCLVRFLQKRREVPLLMTILYGVNAVYLIVFWIAYAGGYSWALAHPVQLYPLPLILQLALSLTWIAYFQTSVRVKNTFVETAGSLAASSRQEPAGFGGWLLLPVGAASLLLAALLYGIVAQNLPAKMAFAVSHAHWLAFARQTTGLGFAGLVIFALAGVFRRKRYARWLILAVFGVVTVLAVMSIIHSDPFWRGAVIAGTLSLAACAYMAVSKRVKNTFVR